MGIQQALFTGTGEPVLFGDLYAPTELDERTAAAVWTAAVDEAHDAADEAAELDGQQELDGIGDQAPFTRGEHVQFSMGCGRVVGCNIEEVAIELGGRTWLRPISEVTRGPAAYNPPRCAVCARRDHKPGDQNAGHAYRDPADRRRRGEIRFPVGALVQLTGGPREYVGCLAVVELVESPTMRVVKLGRDRKATGTVRVGIRGLRLHEGPRS